jgi:hypothetical protein
VNYLSSKHWRKLAVRDCQESTTLHANWKGVVTQYIEIQKRWVSHNFHCPVCGAEVFSEDGEPTGDPCQHVLFSWIDEVGEFYNAADEVKPILEDDENWLSPSDEEFLSRCPDTAVLFALESSGIACGPVSFTVIHAIKFPESICDEADGS